MKSGHLIRQVVNKINGIDFNIMTERQRRSRLLVTSMNKFWPPFNDLQSAGNAGEYYTPRAVTAPIRPVGRLFMVGVRIDPRPGEILLDPACGTGGFLTCSLSHMVRYLKRPEHMGKALA